MNILTLQSTYGGLLHDTGKAVYRAGGQRGSHSEQGYQFLHGVLPGAGWPRCAVLQRLSRPIPRPISFI